MPSRTVPNINVPPPLVAHFRFGASNTEPKGHHRVRLDSTSRQVADIERVAREVQLLKLIRPKARGCWKLRDAGWIPDHRPFKARGGMGMGRYGVLSQDLI